MVYRVRSLKNMRLLPVPQHFVMVMAATKEVGKVLYPV